MIKSGIVDSLRVVRTALVDAAGVCSLTTSVASLVEGEEEKPAGGLGMGGMGMGGMHGWFLSHAVGLRVLCLLC